VSGHATLSVGGQAVAQYVWRPRLPVEVSPRPYLHPVRTLSGTHVTELMPRDHLHHLGVSVAVPDVNGANFWGGRTFVASRGPVPLPNHGTQTHRGWIAQDTGALRHELHWTGPDGTDLLHEQRHIAARPIDDHAWVLELTFELTNIAPVPLAFASPATNGRPGAGYGGFFWRAPRGRQRIHVIGPDRTGESHLHGRATPWLALTGAGDDGPWTLLFIAEPDRWFVRSKDYVGVGSSLAWQHPLVVGRGERVRRRITTVVADGRLRFRQLAALADGVIRRRAEVPG
jgi:hypothetical protein